MSRKKPPAVEADIKRRLLEWIAHDGRASEFLKQVGGLSPQTIANWRAKDPEFAAQYYAARKQSVERIVHESLDIVDAAPLTYVDADGNTRIDPADVANRKLRSWHRLQLAARLDPDTYGERINTKSQGVVLHVVTGVPDAARDLAIDVVPHDADA